RWSPVLGPRSPPPPPPPALRPLSERTHGLVLARAARGARAQLRLGRDHHGDRRSAPPWRARVPRRERAMRRQILAAALVVVAAGPAACAGDAVARTFSAPADRLWTVTL